MGSAACLTAAGLKGLHAAAERHVGDERVPGLVALAALGAGLVAYRPVLARSSILRARLQAGDTAAL
jgi:hypothetical protein